MIKKFIKIVLRKVNEKCKFEFAKQIMFLIKMHVA